MRGIKIPRTSINPVNYLDQASAADRYKVFSSNDFAVSGLVWMENEFTRSVNVRFGSEADIARIKNE